MSVYSWVTIGGYFDDGLGATGRYIGSDAVASPAHCSSRDRGRLTMGYWPSGTEKRS